MQTKLSTRLKEILEAEDLTIYRASIIIGKKTNKPMKSIHERLSQWVRKTPKTFEQVEIAVRSLGYEIVIKKREEEE